MALTRNVASSDSESRVIETFFNKISTTGEEWSLRLDKVGGNGLHASSLLAAETCKAGRSENRAGTRPRHLSRSAERTVLIGKGKSLLISLRVRRSNGGMSPYSFPAALYSHSRVHPRFVTSVRSDYYQRCSFQMGSWREQMLQQCVLIPP